jgi:hypothetical protein
MIESLACCLRWFAIGEAEVRALIQIGCLDPHAGGAQASEPRAKINPGQTTLMRNFSKTKNWI